jgi:putative flippase GtrA
MTAAGRRSFLRFLVVGVVNTGVGLATIAAALTIFGAQPYVANALGFAVGILVGYEINRRWAFGSSRSALITAPRYLLMFAVSYAINLGVLTLALRQPGVPPLLAQVAAIFSYSMVFYLLCRLVVFPAGK